MLNPLPKWVISRTASGDLGTWNGTAYAGEAAESVAKLKDEVDGDLVMTGCGELASALLNAELVDEVWLAVHPALGGPGNRPYADAAGLTMRRLDATGYQSGVIRLRYAPVPRAEA